MHDFDSKALNDGLTDAPLFHGKKIYSVSTFRREKNSWYGKRQPLFNQFLEKKIQFQSLKNSHGCSPVELLKHPGDNGRYCITVFIIYIYTYTLLSNIKVRANNKSLYCTDIVE